VSVWRPPLKPWQAHRVPSEKSRKSFA